MEPLVVLDVDGTLVSYAEQLNTKLLEALKIAGITKVILLTNMGADEIARTLSTQGTIPYLSRVKIINTLRSFDIEVVDVIIPADLALQHELRNSEKKHRVGDAYLEIREWLDGKHRKSFDEVIGNSDPDHFFTKIFEAPTKAGLTLQTEYLAFKTKIENYTYESLLVAHGLQTDKGLIEVQEELDAGIIMPSQCPNPKGKMLKVYLDQHPELQNSEIIFFDDNEDCLASVKAEFPQAKLVLVNINQDNAAYYRASLGIKKPEESTDSEYIKLMTFATAVGVLYYFYPPVAMALAIITFTTIVTYLAYNWFNMYFYKAELTTDMDSLPTQSEIKRNFSPIVTPSSKAAHELAKRKKPSRRHSFHEHTDEDIIRQPLVRRASTGELYKFFKYPNIDEQRVSIDNTPFKPPYRAKSIMLND